MHDHGVPTKQPIRIATDRDPWDRQPGESVRQYARFRTYVELGRGRDLKQTKEILDGLGDVITAGTLYQTSYTYRWTDRADAFDHDQDDHERRRLSVLRRAMVERHRKIATALTAKALQRLQSMNIDELTPLDLVRFIDLAVKLERTALGEPERTIAVSGPGGGPVPIDDYSRLTPDERRARLRALAREMLARAGIVDDDDEPDGEPDGR